MVKQNIDLFSLLHSTLHTVQIADSACCALWHMVQSDSPQFLINKMLSIQDLSIVYYMLLYSINRVNLATLFNSYVAKSIWSFFCMTLRPLDLRYSTRFPFPMNSVTSLIVSPRTTPINWTKFGCRNDLQIKYCIKHNLWHCSTILGMKRTCWITK